MLWSNIGNTPDIGNMNRKLSIIQTLPREEARRYLWDIMLNAGYSERSAEITFTSPKDYGILMELQEEGYIELFDLPKL